MIELIEISNIFSIPQRRNRMQPNRGFTLIEVLIVVAIVAILAAVALPAYSDHVIRGKMTEATSTLGGLRVNLEQYYQDNRKYNGATSGTCGVTMPATPAVKYFTFTCASSAASGAGDQQYVITATGSAPGMTGFVYTIDYNNNKTTTIASPADTAKWGTGNAACWITRANGC
jgi:type IV pilus assembly protein PilE